MCIRDSFLTRRRGDQRRAQRSAPTLLDGRFVVQSGSNHSGHRAADLALWHSSVVQMSASPRVIRPRAWPDWSLHSARSTARCLIGILGTGQEPDATRESARARRAAKRDQSKYIILRKGLGSQRERSFAGCHPRIISTLVSLCQLYLLKN